MPDTRAHIRTHGTRHTTHAHIHLAIWRQIHRCLMSCTGVNCSIESCLVHVSLTSSATIAIPSSLVVSFFMQRKTKLCLSINVRPSTGDRLTFHVRSYDFASFLLPRKSQNAFLMWFFFRSNLASDEMIFSGKGISKEIVSVCVCVLIFLVAMCWRWREMMFCCSTRTRDSRCVQSVNWVA